MGMSRLRVGTCILMLFLIGSVVGGNNVTAQTRPPPVRTAALTTPWGPTPPILGLRDGLLELGYREDEDFVLGVRFTQGDIGALCAGDARLRRRRD